MARRRGGKKHNKGKKKNKKEATQEEDTECDLLCGNKDTVALECCKGTKRLCATCLQKLLYVTQTNVGIFLVTDLKMSDVGVVIHCPFCRNVVGIDRPVQFENGNEAIVKTMMMTPLEAPKVIETPNGHTLCYLDLKLKPIGRDDPQKLGRVLFKFFPTRGETSELKGYIRLYRDGPGWGSSLTRFLEDIW